MKLFLFFLFFAPSLKAFDCHHYFSVHSKASIETFRSSFLATGLFQSPVLHQRAEYRQIFEALEAIIPTGQYTYGRGKNGNLRSVIDAFHVAKNPERIDKAKAIEFMRENDPKIKEIAERYAKYLEKILNSDDYKIIFSKIQFRWSDESTPGIRQGSFHIDLGHYVRTIINVDGKGPVFKGSEIQSSPKAAFFTGGLSENFWGIPAVKHRSSDYDGSRRRIILISFRPVLTKLKDFRDRY